MYAFLRCADRLLTLHRREPVTLLDEHALIEQAARLGRAARARPVFIAVGGLERRSGWART